MICKKFDEKRTKSDQNSKILMLTQNSIFFFFWGGVKKSSQFTAEFSHFFITNFLGKKVFPWDYYKVNCSVYLNMKNKICGIFSFQIFFQGIIKFFLLKSLKK
jgi:hypothetical protein